MCNGRKRLWQINFIKNNISIINREEDLGIDSIKILIATDRP